MNGRRKKFKLVVAAGLATLGLLWAGLGQLGGWDNAQQERQMALIEIRLGLPAPDLYARALAAYYWGEYARAQTLLEAVARNAPKGVPSGVEDELVLWRAECAFRLGQAGQAKVGFSDYLKRCADSPKADLVKTRLEMLGG